MKKLLFVFTMMLAMAACTGNSTKPAVAIDSTAVDTIEMADSVDSALIDTVCIN